MAGRKPKSEPMTQTEMIEYSKQKRATSKIYRAESAQITNEAISKSVINALTEIKKNDSKQRVSLDDIAMVKAVSEAYLESCAVASCFPSMSSLAMALGYTRRNLYCYMAKNSDSETGKYLTQLHDCFANILTESSLRNNSNSIVSIFILKALFGLRESQTIELVQGSQNDSASMEELIERASLLDDNPSDTII